MCRAELPGRDPIPMGAEPGRDEKARAKPIIVRGEERELLHAVLGLSLARRLEDLAPTRRGQTQIRKPERRLDGRCDRRGPGIRNRGAKNFPKILLVLDERYRRRKFALAKSRIHRNSKHLRGEIRTLRRRGATPLITEMRDYMLRWITGIGFGPR